jgi:WD40 repeat protein
VPPAILARADAEILTHGSTVWSLTVLADRRLVSGGDDGNIKIWPKPGTGEPAVLSHPGIISSLAVLPDWRLASGGFDSNIKLWPKERTGEPAVLPQSNPVGSLAVLADGRLASGGGDSNGMITLWPEEGAGAPKRVFARQPGLVAGGVPGWAVRERQRGRLQNLAEGGCGCRRRGSSRRAGGSERWRCCQTGGWPAPATTATSKSGRKTALESLRSSRTGKAVWAPTVLPDGRLVSAGGDGTIKLWPKKFTGEPVVLEHGGLVRALAVLPDGRLASGRAPSTYSAAVSRIHVTGQDALRLYRNGNAADFSPDAECLRPGGSVLGGSDVIAAKMKQAVDLIVG